MRYLSYIVSAFFLIATIHTHKAIGQNTAILFSGIYYIDITNGGGGSALNFTTGNFTIEAWIRPSLFASSANNYEHTIIGNDDTANGGGYVLRTGGSRKLSFSYNYGGGWTEIVTPNPVLVQNQWQHVAVSKNGGVIALYVDAQVVGTAILTSNTNIASSTRTTKISENGSLNKRNFYGGIDEVKIWNTVRTQQQVEFDGTEICSNFPSNLVAYYKLNELRSSSNTIVCANNGALNAIVTSAIFNLPGAPLLPGNSTILYVDSSRTQTGCGNQVGYSWATAFSNLDTALAVAFGNPQIEKIYVAKGTYYPGHFPYAMQNDLTGPQKSSTNNKDRTFHLRPGLEIYGGYPSGGGVPNHIINETILDGSRSGGVLHDTAYNVVYMDTSNYWTKPNDTTKLVGFTIKNGNAQLTGGQGLGTSGGFGAGLYCYRGVHLVQNCVFTNNKGVNSGWAIATKLATTVIIGNKFTNNTGVQTTRSCIHTESGNTTIRNNNIYGFGKGIRSDYGYVYIFQNEIAYNTTRGIDLDITKGDIIGNYIHHNQLGISVGYSELTSIIGNTITDNTNLPNTHGAGIYLYGGTQIVVDNYIARNSASIGGGICFFNSVYNNISGNTITKNTATASGGGIYGQSGTNRLQENIVLQNTASREGGLKLSGNHDTVVGNMIVKNKASNIIGGGSIGTGLSAIFANNIIAENDAPQVGGIACNGVDSVVNNTFYNNRATDTTYYYNSGALLLEYGKTQVSNNVFWRNKIGNSDTAQKADYFRLNNDSSIRHIFRHNLLQRSAISYTKGDLGNYDIGASAANNFFGLDPVFANSANISGVDGIYGTNDDGLQLANISPLIDAGDSTLFPSFGHVDISGAIRVYGNNIDMGAYELSCSPANISASPAVCKGNSALLRINSVAHPQDVYWYSDSLSISVLATGYSFQTPVLQKTDTFWVSVAGCSDSAKKPMIVMVPYASISKDSLTLRANSGGSSYQWLTCNPYQPIPGANDSIYNATKNGDYAVVVEQYGCYDTSGCINITGVSIEDVTEAEMIVIRPNPTNGAVYISSLTDLAGSVLYITNVQGQAVYKSIINANDTLQLDISTLPNAIYYIIISGPKHFYTSKLVKQ